MSHFETDKELANRLKRMVEHHGDDLQGALAALEKVQFDRFMATSPKEEKAREDVYFSVLGAREFIAFLSLVASRASDDVTAL